MSSVAGFIEKLAALGVRLKCEGEQLRYEAPKGSLTPALVEELKQFKPEILRYLKETDAAITVVKEGSELVSVSRGASIPLSFAQQRLWFLYQLEGPSPAYNILAAQELIGEIDIPSLEMALSGIVHRHEMLRTVFRAWGPDGQAEQVIQGEGGVRLRIVDFRDLSREEADRGVTGLAKEESQWRFKLEESPLVRMTLVRLSDKTQQLRLTMHHIIGDGWSLGILMRDLAECYRAAVQKESPRLAPLGLHYADFAVWQRTWLTGEILARQERFWRERLKGAPLLLELPIERPRPTVQSYRGAVVPLRFNAEFTRRLNELSAAGGASLYMTMVSVYGVMLAKYTHQTDLLIGTQVANRNRRELESVVGFFINTIVLRLRVHNDAAFLAYLRDVKREVLDVLEHQDFPFEKLVELLQPERILGRNPVVQAMFLWQNTPSTTEEIPRVRMRSIEVDRTSAKFDLTFEMGESGEEIVGVIEYNTDLFDEGAVLGMAARFKGLLEQVVASPETPISGLRLSTAEDERALASWNETFRKWNDAESKTLHGLFEAAAERYPERLAVVAAGNQVTYRELDERANRLALYLTQEGIGPEALVAVCLERSVNLVVALLGILKAGGAYMPLDPNHPDHRNAMIVTNARAACLIAREATPLGRAIQGVPVISVEQAQASEHARCQPVADQNLAYVIHTSGSTGTPKGVMIEHRSAVNLVHALLEQVWLPDMALDRVGLVAPVVFDASVQQIFATLARGSTLYVVDEEARRDGDSLRAFLAGNEIQLCDATPTLLRLLAGSELPASLRQVLVGGEPLPMDLVRAFSGEPVRFSNVYGPTECTVDATVFTLAPELDAGYGTSVPIGKPLANLRVSVLNADDDPCPPGVVGELFIGGAGLGRGYLGDPSLTAERFSPDPVLPGQRVYRTGDVGRWRSDGLLEFLGRNDGQVKVRGFRIELGEIEHHLRALPEVRDASVAVTEHGLVAWLVLDKELTVEAIRGGLREGLPDHMIPAQFRRVEKLPVNRSGKIDRRQLLALPGRLLEQGAFALDPRTDIERTLAEVWRKILGAPVVSVRDNFFSLGGDSIKALQIGARLREAGYGMEIRDLFLHPNIEELAPHLKIRSRVPAWEGAITGRVPLLPLQARFFRTETVGLHHYNQAVLLDPPHRLKPGPLTAALKAVIDHHDALRSRFYHEEFGWVCEVMPPGEAPVLEIVDLSNEPDPIRIRRERSAAAQARFKLEAGGLFSAVLFRGNHGDQLLLAAHHLVIDGVSWRIVLEDIVAAYGMAERGVKLALPERTTSVKVFAETMGQLARSEMRQEELYWRSVEAEASPQLPSEPGLTQTSAAAMSCSCHCIVDSTQTEHLRGPAHHVYGTEVNDLLLTALVRALRRWHGSSKSALILEGHGREVRETGLDLTRTVGWFTSLYPVQIDLGEGDDLGRQIKRVKESLRAIPHKGSSYGWLAETGPELISRLPMEGRVVFNYLGEFDGTEATTGWRRADGDIGPCSDPAAKSPYDLEVVGMVSNGQFRFGFSGKPNRFSAASLQRLADFFAAEIEILSAHLAGKRDSELTPSDIDYDGFTVEKLDQFLERF